MQSPDGHMATRRLPSNAEDEIIPMSTAAVNVSVDVAAAAAAAPLLLLPLLLLLLLK